MAWSAVRPYCLHATYKKQDIPDSDKAMQFTLDRSSCNISEERTQPHLHNNVTCAGDLRVARLLEKATLACAALSPFQQHIAILSPRFAPGVFHFPVITIGWVRA